MDRDAAGDGLTRRGSVSRVMWSAWLTAVNRFTAFPPPAPPSFGSATAAPALLPEGRRRHARQSEGRAAAACKAEGEGAAACEPEGEGAAAVAAVRVGDCWVKLRNDHTAL